VTSGSFDISNIEHLAANGFSLLVDSTVRGSLLLAVVALIAAYLSRRSASARHLAWALGVAGLLVLPLLVRTLPTWGVLPAWSVSIGSTAEQSAIPGIASSDLSLFGQISANWHVWIMGAWLAGAVYRFLCLAAAQWKLRALTVRCDPASRGRLALETLRLLVRLGITRTVELLQGPAGATPMTWGVVRVKLLLPEDSHEWPEGRLRSVLMHEIAHIERWDCLTQFVANVACAVFWFNPLVWLAVRKMRHEREAACDDRVLLTGTSAPDYAEHLLEISRGMQPSTVALAATGGADRPSHLAQRVEAILDDRRSRQPVTRGGLMASVVVLSLFVTLLAMVGVSDGPSSDFAVYRPATMQPPAS